MRRLTGGKDRARSTRPALCGEITISERQLLLGRSAKIGQVSPFSYTDPPDFEVSPVKSGRYPAEGQRLQKTSVVYTYIVERREAVTAVRRPASAV